VILRSALRASTVVQASHRREPSCLNQGLVLSLGKRMGVMTSESGGDDESCLVGDSIESLVGLLILLPRSGVIMSSWDPSHGWNLPFPKSLKKKNFTPSEGDMAFIWWGHVSRLPMVAVRWLWKEEGAGRMELCVARNLSHNEEISEGWSNSIWAPPGTPLWPVGSSQAHGLRARCPANFEVGGSSNC
jgi:hypothetical protein